MIRKSIWDVPLAHEKSADPCEFKKTLQQNGGEGVCALGDCDYNRKINIWKT